MSPRAIVARAKEVGLDAIALADHNSALNQQALIECCRQEGLACLCGMEICVAEEFHVLAVFDELETSLEMTRIVYAALPKRVNQPEVFGDQPVVNANEEIDEMEWRLLSAPTRLTLREVESTVHRMGGLLVACHIDRPVFSVVARFGVLSGNEGFDAMEISRHARPESWRRHAGPLPLIASSDAHYLDDIGQSWTEADLSAFTVQELKQAFRHSAVRIGRG